MSGSVVGIGFIALAELETGGGGELVCTDHGVPKAGRVGETEPPPPPGFCISGKAAASMLLPPVPLLMWWALGDSIWVFTLNDGASVSRPVEEEEEEEEYGCCCCCFGGSAC